MRRNKRMGPIGPAAGGEFRPPRAPTELNAGPAPGLPASPGRSPSPIRPVARGARAGSDPADRLFRAVSVCSPSRLDVGQRWVPPGSGIVVPSRQARNDKARDDNQLGGPILAPVEVIGV